VLLVRNETSPEDLRGMIAAEGILTRRRREFARGACRAQMERFACRRAALQIDYAAKTVTLTAHVSRGRRFSINGTAGESMRSD